MIGKRSLSFLLLEGPFRWKDPLAGGSVKGAPDKGGWGRVRDGQLGVLNFVLSMLHNVNITKHIKYRSSVVQETQAPSTTSWSPSLPEGGFN